MSELNFIKNYYQIFTAIDYCITENLIMPALILIYSSIDSISWVVCEDENQLVGTRFKTWVDSWMLQKYPLPCTALELYAARCGILHTLTANSKLTDKKTVRLISYAWGTGQEEDLTEAIKRMEYPNLVAVHVNDIFYSFKNGLADFMESLESDRVKKDLFNQRIKKGFANIDISLVRKYLTYSKNDGV